MTSIYGICLHQVSTTIDKVTCYLVNCVYGEYNYSYCGLKNATPILRDNNMFSFCVMFQYVMGLSEGALLLNDTNICDLLSLTRLTHRASKHSTP